MNTFHDLANSRRQWISEVLAPWCKSANRKDLLLAEHEWTDLAGKPSPEMTLWKWAWERFPILAHQGSSHINETLLVTVWCADGRQATGYPDASRSEGGLLVLLNQEQQIIWPFAIDEISQITVSDESCIDSDG